jgi:ketosteroid isomerase-like protein
MAKSEEKTVIVEGGKRLLYLLALSVAFAAAGCNSAQQPAAPDTRTADEAAVRKADGDWSKAAQTKQVDAWMAFYSDDVVALPPNEKVANTKDNIRKSVGELLALPSMAISWRPTKVEVARSGDIAYSFGAYEFTANDAHGKPITENGKYVEIWKKQADGSWKCAVDIWNPDTPVMPPAAP